MAEIADGTYIIRNVANTSLSLNIKGATDGNGQNVWLYTVNRLADGGYANVQTKESGGDTWRIITFPATGKAVSVQVTDPHGIPAQGDNVYQWDVRGGGIGGGEQQWVIEDTGSTATFDGTEYSTYKIWMFVTLGGGSYTPRLLEYQGTGTPVSGGNLCIAADESTAQDQMWIFEPVDQIFPGTYRIVSRTNPDYCCYVNGGSKSAGARIGVQPWTGAANQVWLVEDAGGGRIVMRPTHSFGDFATFNTSAAARLDKCCQDNHAPAETDHLWIPYPIPGKSLVTDGTSYQCHELSIVAGTGDLVLDLPSNDLRNWLQIYAANGTDAQMWAFVPADTQGDDLPVPVRVGVTYGGETYRSGTAPWDSTAPVHAVWECPGTKYQARYRTRIIGVSDTGTETYPDGWTGWKSMADGTESNDGWGTAWLPNQTFESPADYKVSADVLDVPALTASNPAVDVEIEVRYFTEDWGIGHVTAHGPSASCSVRLYQPMTVTVDSVTRTGEGLVVAFSSDWAVGSTTARVSDLTAGDGDMVDAVSESGKYAASDTITVPWTDIDDFVAIGDTVDLTLDLTTSLGVAGSVQYSGTVVDGGDRGVTVTSSETPHASYTVTVPHDAGESTQLLLLRDGLKPLVIAPASVSDSSDVYDVVVPLATSGRYEVVVQGFAVDVIALQPITRHFCVWTFGDGDFAILDYGRDAKLTQDDVQEHDDDDFSLTSRQYRAYRMRETRARDLTVSGVVIDSMPEHGTREALTRLLEAGHATYRNMRGEIFNVFVSNVTMNMTSYAYTDVVVTQHAESR